MKALLLIAHGSRRKQSNDEVVLIAEKLQAANTSDYGIYQAGFLEIATPSIDIAIDRCLKKGASSITVLPYFLNSGLHVIKDIPNAVKKAQMQYPDTRINIAPHIGASEIMLTLLIDAANSIN